jgi:drug/metabolite transporter (DMT)-like permease
MTEVSPNPLKALALLLSAVFLFEIVGVCAKLLSASYPVGMIIFARNFFALWPLALGILMLGGKSLLTTRQPRLHIVRGLVGMATMYCSFAAIGSLPLATLTALQFTMPIFMVILAALWLRERLSFAQIGAVGFGFAGAMLIANPANGTFNFATLLALLAALCGGTASVMARQLTKTDHSLTIAFYYSLASALFGAVMLTQGFMVPNLHDLALFMAAGFAGGVAQLLLTQAYRHAAVGVIAPYEYSSLLWASLFGWMFWGDIPTVFTLAGAVIIIAADLIVLLQAERRRATA